MKSIKSGCVMKRTKNKCWVKREFSLYPTYLTYCSKKKLNQVKIPTSTIQNVEMESKRQDKENIFRVITVTGITLILKCSTYEKAWKWVYKLKGCMIGCGEKCDGGIVALRSDREFRTSRVTWPVAITDFGKGGTLGIGSYGHVFLAEFLPTGKHYAVKQLEIEYLEEKGQLERTEMELEILKLVDHPFIIRMHYDFRTSDSFYFVLDCANGGELAYHLEKHGRFDEARARFYAAEIFLGIRYLHKRGIMYRDLKSRNVLLDSSGHIVLTDFGLSKIIGIQRTSSMCGTPEYFSPDMIRAAYLYSKEEVDWWAFGILIFEMLTGELPFDNEVREDLFWDILKKEIKFPSIISETAADLINKLTKKESLFRLIEPNKIKNHEFFAGVDWTAILKKSVPPPFIPNVEDSTDLQMVYSELADFKWSFTYDCAESSTVSTT